MEAATNESQEITQQHTGWNPRVLRGCLAFWIPVVIMVVLLIMKEIFPLGDRTILFSDMYHQYVPFFTEFMNQVKNGGSMFYSWEIGLGSNFLALYGYYLASPVFWLGLFIPDQYIMELLTAITVLKIGACGLTCFLYLENRLERARGLGLFCSIFYAFSGFVAAYYWNIMWMDGVVLLPLILLGLEKLYREGKWKLYTISLGFCILSNFYCSIMICIFIVLYVITLMISDGIRWSGICKFAGASLLSGGLAAVLLIPEVCALMDTKFGQITITEDFKSYFSVLDVLMRHSVGTEAERGLAHWPNIYCGVAVFILVPLFIVNHKISLRKRFSLLALTGFMLFSFCINYLDLFWHGMNYPDSLPGRQSYIYCLLVIMLCYEALYYLSSIATTTLVKAVALGVGFALLVEKFRDPEYISPQSVLLTILFIAGYGVILYFYKTRRDTFHKFFLGALVIVVIFAEVGYHMIQTSLGTYGRDNYFGKLETYSQLIDGYDEENELYRIEKFSRRTKNDGALINMKTASLFSSTLNSYVVDFYKHLGMRNSKVYYAFDGATPLTAAMLQVRYMLGEDGEENSLYTKIDKQEDIVLYEAAAVLPFGFVLPYEYDLPFDKDYNSITLQNHMVKELLGEDAGELFTYVSGSSDSKEAGMSIRRDGIYYARVTNSGTKKLKLAKNQQDAREYDSLKYDCILYVGALESGDYITFTNLDDNDTTPDIGIKLYRLNEELLQRAIDKMGAESLDNLQRTDSSLSGEITLQKPGRVVMTVPVDKGWRVYVDGAQTEAAAFGEAFIALDLQPGTHHIDMSFEPYGLKAGACVSVLSIILVVIFSFFDIRRKK